MGWGRWVVTEGEGAGEVVVVGGSWAASYAINHEITRAHGQLGRDHL